MAPASKPDLVLSGGGVKSVGLVGAVVALKDAGYQPQRVSSTSAGSIVCAAAAQTQEMTGAQVKELALQLDYRKFLDPGEVERVPLQMWHIVGLAHPGTFAMIIANIESVAGLHPRHILQRSVYRHASAVFQSGRGRGVPPPMP